METNFRGQPRRKHFLNPAKAQGMTVRLFATVQRQADRKGAGFVPEAELIPGLQLRKTRQPQSRLKNSELRQKKSSS